MREVGVGTKKNTFTVGAALDSASPGTKAARTLLCWDVKYLEGLRSRH